VSGKQDPRNAVREMTERIRKVGVPREQAHKRAVEAVKRAERQSKK